MSNSSPIEQRRLKLHAIFESIPGVAKVYFQPPPGVMMKYPCIRYNRDGGEIMHSNDLGYTFHPRYTVTVIDPDPTSDISEKLIRLLPMLQADRNYTADNLNHSVFSLYY